MSDEQQWTEWGVRRTWGDVGSVAFFERDHNTARKCAKDWPGILVSRVVTAGDWTTHPAPTHHRPTGETLAEETKA